MSDRGYVSIAIILEDIVLKVNSSVTIHSLEAHNVDIIWHAVQGFEDIFQSALRAP